MTHCRSLTTLLLGFALIARGSGAQARVRVQVTDVLGNDVSPDRIWISNDVSKARLEIKQGTSLNTEFGKYTLSVSAAGFADMRIPVIIDQRDQILTVALKLGKMEGEIPACSIHGHFSPVAGPVRIRLIELFGLDIRDVPVDSGGGFEIGNLACGSYLVIAVRGKECISTITAVAAVAPVPVHLSPTAANSDACDSNKR